MPTQTRTDKKITLHYPEPNRGTYTFSRISLTASDQMAYVLGELLNSVQEDPMSKVTITDTFLIV